MSATHKLRLDDQLCFALYAATNAVTRVYKPLLEALRLTYPQYLVLIVLWEQPGAQRMGALARQLGLPPSALTPLVDRLVSARLLKKIKDPLDGRSSMVSLTVRGACLEAAASRAQSAVACRTHLSERRFVALRKQLHDLTRTLEPAETDPI